MEKCTLCGKMSELRESHLIPSFVGLWLKKTSLTGYLRQAVNPNLRKQDISKEKLLCQDCENMLSVAEKRFKEEIFSPYTDIELDDWAIARGVIKSIEYGKWLLDFIIGLQWKCLVTHEKISPTPSEDQSVVDDYNNRIIPGTLLEWKDYLLGKRADTGESRHYLVFLQNIAPNGSELPDRIHEKVNTYLIRSVDSTLVISNRLLYVYTKLGPILIISALKPNEFKRMDDARVRMKGKIFTAQHLRNKRVNEFVFVIRPNEAFSQAPISSAQSGKIEAEILKKVSRTANMQELNIIKSDLFLKRRKKP